MNFENISWIIELNIIFLVRKYKNIGSEVHVSVVIIKNWKHSLKYDKKGNFVPKNWEWYKIGFWKPEHTQRYFSLFLLSFSLFLFIPFFFFFLFLFSLLSPRPSSPFLFPYQSLLGPAPTFPVTNEASLTKPSLVRHRSKPEITRNATNGAPLVRIARLPQLCPPNRHVGRPPAQPQAPTNLFTPRSAWIVAQN